MRCFGLLKHHREAIEFLAGHDYRRRERWLFSVYEGIPPENVCQDFVDQLYQLYEQTELHNLPNGFRHLANYLQVDSEVFPRVVKILLSRLPDEPDLRYALYKLFYLPDDLASRILEFFTDDYNTLMEAYFVADSVRDHSDHNGHYFNLLIDCMPAFPI